MARLARAVFPGIPTFETRPPMSFHRLCVISATFSAKMNLIDRGNAR
jgi:hypothetical protein